MSEEESGAAFSARDALWSLAIAQRKKISITATEWDELMTILFLNETATFQLSEAISKMQIGDIAGSKIVNSAAVETSQKALALSKALLSGVKDQVVNAKTGEDLPHES